MEEKIVFTTDDGQEVDLFVVEQTRINGRDYLLVAQDDDEESEAFILKDISDSSDAEAIYEFVEDEVELDAVAKVFKETLEDIDFK